MSDAMKICTRCKIECPIDDFYFERGHERRKSICKECCKDVVREWRRNNPDKWKIQNDRRRKKGPAISWKRESI